MAGHNNSKRFEGTLKIDGASNRRKEVVATIVGPGGSNIRRITQQVSAGTFIRVYDSRQGRNTRARAEDCDTIYISSYKKEAVQKAAQMLRQDIKSVLEGTAPSKPRAIVPCPKEARGTVIGQRAAGLKRIQKMCGDGTYIVFKEQFDGFEVTSNSKVSLQRAVVKIGESIQKYYSDQKAWANRKRATNNTAVDTASNGSRFDALVSSSDDDSSDEDEPKEDVEAPQVKRNVTLSIQPRKDYMTEQRNERRLIHQIREELAKRTDPNTGEPLYPAYTIRDKKTRQVIHLEGARAVPIQVAKDELRRRQREEEQQLEQARGMAQRRREQEAFDRTLNDEKSWPSVSKQPDYTGDSKASAWSNGVSASVRDSNFTQKKSVSIRRKAPISSSYRQEPEENTMLDLGTVQLSRREKVAEAGSRSRLISNNTSLQNALGDLASEQSRLEKLTIQTTPKRKPLTRVNSPPPSPENVKKITDAWGSDDEDEIPVQPLTKKSGFSWADEADTSSDEEDGW